MTSRSMSDSTLSEEVVALLMDHPMFARIDSEELMAIGGYMGARKLAAGEYLFRQGETGDFMGFVIDGRLRIIKESEEGPVTIARLDSGRSIGEMALIESVFRSASARAEQACELLVLRREGFDYILSQRPQLGVRLMRDIAALLSQNLRETSGELADLLDRQ